MKIRNEREEIITKPMETLKDYKVAKVVYMTLLINMGWYIFLPIPSFPHPSKKWKKHHILKRMASIQTQRLFLSRLTTRLVFLSTHLLVSIMLTKKFLSSTTISFIQTSRDDERLTGLSSIMTTRKSKYQAFVKVRTIFSRIS